MEERIRFVAAHQNGLWSMSELCRHFGVSRRVGYKLLVRNGQEGLEGLKDRSRAPRRSDNGEPFVGQGVTGLTQLSWDGSNTKQRKTEDKTVTYVAGCTNC